MKLIAGAVRKEPPPQSMLAGAPEDRGPRRPARARIWVVAVLVGMAVVALGTAVDYALRARLPRPPLVMLAPVSKGIISGTIHATGTLEPAAMVTVSQPISGRIIEISAVGERVDSGQVLARFDPLALRAEFARSGARLAAAEAAAFDAEVALSRVVRAGSPGPPYQGPFDEKAAADLDDARGVAEARAASATAEVTAREAAYRVAHQRLKQGVVRAPFMGIVLSREVEPGETVSAGAPLLKIATGIERLNLVAEVPEAEIARVKGGQRAHFSVPAYPGRTFEAEVARSGPLRGPEGARRFAVTLTVDHSAKGLQPGMTAAVVVETKSDRAVFRVPVAALGFRPRQWGATSPDEHTIWITDPASCGGLVRTAVEVGVAEGPYAEVSAPGLREGAGVATGYALGVTP